MAIQWIPDWMQFRKNYEKNEKYIQKVIVVALLIVMVIVCMALVLIGIIIAVGCTFWISIFGWIMILFCWMPTWWIYQGIKIYAGKRDLIFMLES